MLALAQACFAPCAQALAVFDAVDAVDNTRNVIDHANPATYPTGPATGVPWNHVIRFGTNNASAVYIGHRFFLTANHVGVLNSGLVLNGVSYNRDTTFTPVQLVIPSTPANVPVDVTLQRLATDPGLPVLPIIGPATTDTDVDCVHVGWGVGKGTVLPGTGWAWGDNTTRALRWGTNRTANGLFSVPYQSGTYTALGTYFNPDQGPDESQAMLGDSGSALFQNVSGTWTLSGITTAVSTANASKYVPPDVSAAARLRQYSWLLRVEHWKTAYGIPQVAADASDDDGDGVPLLLEYALGMVPTRASTTGLPQAVLEGSQLSLVFQRLATTTDVKVEVETSTSLAPNSWGVEAATFTPLAATTVLHTIKASVPAGNAGRKFARLRVTRL